MNDNELSKLERITIRIFLIAVLIWVTLVIYQSCSATFIKGHHNSSSSKEAVEADGDELELMGRHKKNDSPVETQPIETVTDTIQLDTVSE